MSEQTCSCTGGCAQNDCAERGSRGCGSCGGCGLCCGKTEPVTLDAPRKEFLVELETHGYLPVTRFVRTSSVSDELYAVALEPVYLSSTGDTVETVRKTGAFLSAMAQEGLISLDYGTPLDGYPYFEYTTSALYQAFVKATRRGGDCEGDTPYLELGSIAPTAKGRLSLAIS